MDFKIAPQKIIFTYATCTSLTNKLKENSCKPSKTSRRWKESLFPFALFCLFLFSDIHMLELSYNLIFFNNLRKQR